MRPFMRRTGKATALRGVPRPAGRGGAAYLEFGIAALRANAFPGASKSARVMAEHLVLEVVRSGVATGLRQS